MYKIILTDTQNITHSIFNLPKFTAQQPSHSSLSITQLEKTSTVLKIGKIPITIEKDFTRSITRLSNASVHLFLLKKSRPSTDIVILGIPEEMTESAFLDFLSASIRYLPRIVMLHSERVNLAVLRFVSAQEACKFQTEFSGIQFIADRPEYCQILSVESDPDLKMHSSGYEIEMPTCPLCMERIDAAITHIPTSKCDHQKDVCLCSTKWKSHGNCQVCQLILNPPVNYALQCSECEKQSETLWICMICAYLGCGRYAKGHARKHFELNPTHCFAIDVEFQRVWDYSADRYVHRVIHFVSQNRILEFPGPSVPSQFSFESYSECQEKQTTSENNTDCIIRHKDKPLPYSSECKMASHSSYASESSDSEMLQANTLLHKSVEIQESLLSCIKNASLLEQILKNNAKKYSELTELSPKEKIIKDSSKNMKVIATMQRELDIKEQKITELIERNEILAQHEDTHFAQLKHLQLKYDSLCSEGEIIKQNHIAELSHLQEKVNSSANLLKKCEKNYATAMSELSQTKQRVQIVTEQLEDERLLSNKLMSELSTVKAKFAEAKNNEQALQEQINDLMRHFELQCSLSEDAKNGDLVLKERKKRSFK